MHGFRCDRKDKHPPYGDCTARGIRTLAAAQLPRRRGERWTIELAPLLRMQDWRIEPLQSGDAVSVVGYAAPGEEGPAVLRAEFLFVGDKAYGLRSSPA